MLLALTIHVTALNAARPNRCVKLCVDLKISSSSIAIKALVLKHAKM